MEKEKFINVIRLSVDITDNGNRMYLEKEIKIENTLKSLYKEIDCELVDVVSVEIGNKYFDIWYDDEALCRATIPAPVLALGNDPRSKDFQIIFGTVIFANCDDDGNMCSLSETDVKNIKKWLKERIRVLENWIAARKFAMYLNSINA